MLVMGFLCSFAALVEPTYRIKEYSLFIIPRIIPGPWDLLKKLGFVSNLFGENGEVAQSLIFAVSMGCLYNIKENFDEYLNGDHYLKFITNQLLVI